MLETQTSLISSSLASSLLSFLLSLHSPPPPPLLTKALCTQPLPLAAVSEPRPYENHMGEKRVEEKGVGRQAGPAPLAGIFPLPSGCALGGWHALPHTLLTTSWWLHGLNPRLELRVPRGIFARKPPP